MKPTYVLPVLLVAGLISLGVLFIRYGTPNCDFYDQEIPAEDIRLCAPAPSPTRCLRRLGYKWSCRND